MKLASGYCKGCGAKIQFESPNVPGYIPREVYTKRITEGKEVLCQRCFQLKYYSKLKHISFSDKIKWNYFKELVKDFKNILWVIDIFDFEGSFRSELIELFKEKNVIYVINKIDLIPKAVSRKEIFNWALERIRSDQIYLVSVSKNFGIETLFRRLKIMNEKILVVGCTNVGKSSLLNKLCGIDITTSSFPNTTLGLIRAKLPESNAELFDTPGISFEDRFIDLLSFNCQKKILPVVNRVYLFGALAQIKVKNIKDEKALFQLFAPENVVLHDAKLERVAELLEKQTGRFLVPPCKPNELSVNSLNWIKKSIIIDQGLVG